MGKFQISKTFAGISVEQRGNTDLILEKFWNNVTNFF